MSLVFKSYVTKFTFVGGFFNEEKLYLFKEIFIISMILVACISINTVILWPVALAASAAIVLFVLLEAFAIPFSFKATAQVQEKNNNKI